MSYPDYAPCQTATQMARHEKEADDYRKISVYLESLAALNPPNKSGNTVVEIQYLDRHLNRVFVCPGLGAYVNALRFMALKGVRIRNCFNSTLLTATFCNNHGGYFLLAWAIVESESARSW